MLHTSYTTRFTIPHSMQYFWGIHPLIKEVFHCMLYIQLKTAAGPDNIPNKIFKELANIMVGGVKAIINSSTCQGVDPYQSKLSCINPFVKTFPLSSVENDITPILNVNTSA